MSHPRTTDEISSEWGDHPRWQGIRRDYTADDVARLRGSMHVEHSLARRGAEKLWHLVNFEDYVTRAGRADRQPGRANGRGRAQGHLPERLASGGRCQRRRADVSRSEPVSGRQRAGRGAADQQRAAPRRPGPASRGTPRSRLLPADRGRRRSRLRRTAERLRADEGHDRSRRRRRTLRRSVGQREEMRAHGGQGARADLAVRAHAGRCAPGRRRARRAHGAGGPHRCQ